METTNYGFGWEYPDDGRHLTPSPTAEWAEPGAASIGEAPDIRLEPRRAAIALSDKPEEFDRGALEWAKPQLETALKSWQKYGGFNGFLTPVPSTIEDLFAPNPAINSTLARLYNSWKALAGYEGLTPNGERVADTMGLVLVPWEELSLHIEHTSQLDGFLERMRALQGMQADECTPDFLAALTMHHSNFGIPEQLGMERDRVRYRYNPSEVEGMAGHQLSSLAYLQAKIAKDGPWGVVLAQTGSEVGAREFSGKTIEELTNGGRHPVMLAGEIVDRGGYFESLALTMQSDNPRKLTNPWTCPAQRYDAWGSGHMPVIVGYDNKTQKIESRICPTSETEVNSCSSAYYKELHIRLVAM